MLPKTVDKFFLVGYFCFLWKLYKILDFNGRVKKNCERKYLRACLKFQDIVVKSERFQQQQRLVEEWKGVSQSNFRKGPSIIFFFYTTYLDDYSLGEKIYDLQYLLVQRQGFSLTYDKVSTKDKGSQVGSIYANFKSLNDCLKLTNRYTIH